MNIFFDVLDTLLTEEGDPRPHAREVFLELTEIGHDVYLWSTAGGGYAARAAGVLGVEDVVKGCFPKPHPPEGVSVDYVVDDHERYVEDYGGYLIRSYEGGSGDRELLGVVEAVEALEID
jgi:hypothetical protein